MTHTASLPTFVSLNMIDMVIDWWAHQFHVNLERFACTQDRVRIQSHTTHNIGKRKLWSLIGLQNVHKIAQAVKLKCDNGARPEAAVPVVRTQLQLFFFFIYLFAHSRITHKVMCLLHSNDNNNHVNNNMETSSIQVCTLYPSSLSSHAMMRTHSRRCRTICPRSHLNRSLSYWCSIYGCALRIGRYFQYCARIHTEAADNDEWRWRTQNFGPSN